MTGFCVDSSSLYYGLGGSLSAIVIIGLVCVAIIAVIYHMLVKGEVCVWLHCHVLCLVYEQVKLVLNKLPVKVGYNTTVVRK